MSNTHCINCGKAIPKRGGSLFFLPATANGRQNYERSGMDIFLDEELRPVDSEGAARFTNHPITGTTGHRGRINSITFDDGSRIDPYFCKKKCAADFGAKAARAGFRG